VTNSLKAWLAYIRHPARDAGLGLAFLYMTVLGFDNITYGYCLRQCVTESVIGGLVAVSAVFGVMGSLTFPVFRRCVGLNKTGLIGMASLVATLSMCVVSIWLEGSPFDINYFKDKNSTEIESLEFGSTEIESHEYGSADSECYVSSFLSVGLFLAGVIAARFGLWMADLVRIFAKNKKIDVRC
jgi:iron-regulated transporter 1